MLPFRGNANSILWSLIPFSFQPDCQGNTSFFFFFAHKKLHTDLGQETQHSFGTKMHSLLNVFNVTDTKTELWNKTPQVKSSSHNRQLSVVFFFGNICMITTRHGLPGSLIQAADVWQDNTLFPCTLAVYRRRGHCRDRILLRFEHMKPCFSVVTENIHV